MRTQRTINRTNTTSRQSTKANTVRCSTSRPAPTGGPVDGGSGSGDSVHGALIAHIAALLGPRRGPAALQPLSLSLSWDSCAALLWSSPGGGGSGGGCGSPGSAHPIRPWSGGLWESGYLWHLKAALIEDLSFAFFSRHFLSPRTPRAWAGKRSRGTEKPWL